jgi:hypothetical protein
LKARWIFLIIGSILLLDYIQDGMIDGTLWGHNYPMLVALIHTKIEIAFLGTARPKNRLIRIKPNGDIEVELDLKATMKQIRRKEHHHKHES